MKTITILVPESSVMQAIADPQYLFSAVNQFMIQVGKTPIFDIQLVGATKEIKLNDGLYSINTTKQLDEVKNTDLIIIPALFGNMKEAVERNAKLIPWIKSHYKKGTEVASLCVGAFLLASTGILNGKKCSTHWGFHDDFRAMYPEVEVVRDSIITVEDGIYSSGGANSYWNLLLHLVEKYTDRETAILASKYFAIDIDRENQSSFTIFNGQKNHSDESIKKVQEFIEVNVSKKLSIDELSGMVNLGRRNFERRFKASTHNSVLEYINRVKMEFAKRRFEGSKKNINEVMEELGYCDPKSFRIIFKKITGLSPLEYRKKYNKQAIKIV